MMDDAADDETVQRRRNERKQDPKHKYMAILQNVADRLASEITIELDDLEAVSGGPL
jgi:DNA replication licensing factor MCM7